MATFDDLQKERIGSLLRAFYATKSVKNDGVPCKIEEGLYLGSLGAANNKEVLKSLNVTHILTAGSLAPAYPDDFTYKVVKVADKEDTDLAQYFDECIDFVEEATRLGGGVLVHCFVGRSRSVTIVLAYLIKKRNMTLPQALEYVRRKRPQASPNLGFMQQLENYEKSLQGAAVAGGRGGEEEGGTA